MTSFVYESVKILPNYFPNLIVTGFVIKEQSHI